jgi:hypothetical protein
VQERFAGGAAWFTTGIAVRASETFEPSGIAMRQLIRALITGSLLLAPVVGESQTHNQAAATQSTQAQPTPAKVRILPDAPSATRDQQGFLDPGVDPENRLLLPFFKHVASDQVQFWTSPIKVDKRGAVMFAGFAGFTGLLVAGDSWITKQVPDKPDQLRRSQNISNYAVYSLVGAGGGAYLLGKIRKDDLMSETGLLSGEAALNSTAVTYLFQVITQRPRPLQDNGNGTFFHGGYSFPSEHSAIAWSIASVIAHEYPGPLTKFLAYGLASTVTLTRVTGKQHFASDAFVGSALGWYFGRQIYRAHHDTELGGAPWGELVEAKEKGPRDPANMGSPYVPLDSWVYPQLERLAALGYVQSAYLGMRPWTRMECARLLEEAGERLRYYAVEDGQGQQIYAELAREFFAEIGRLDGAANLGASLDSVYARTTGISGKPLRDGYNFGQTIINDFGRPYGEGFNSIDGITAHAEAGPLAFYIRGEYQHAPAVASDPDTVLRATAAAVDIPPLANGKPEVNRFDLLEGLVALNVRNIQISFGKQSLWLGPGGAGPFLLSNNAEPILILRVDSVSPYHLPLISSIFGPVRTEFFVGQLSGHHWEYCIVSKCQQANPAYPNVVGPNISPQPFIHGGKITLKPTANLEIGMGITAMFGGPGLPVTWHNFLRTYYAHSASAATNPGKRISEAHFTYRVPGLRNWLTVYADALVVDEISPIGSTRANVNPGIYMPQIPKIPKLEVRAEGLHESITHRFGPGFVYFDDRRFRDGYTNDGNLMGNWIGRAGRGGQGWLTYSWSPRTRLQLGYRLQEVSHEFIGGGRLVDYSASSDVTLSSKLTFSGLLQYEQWRFPVLSATRQSNVTASVQLTFWPSFGLRAREFLGKQAGQNPTP